jgi:hypothetical protein
MVVLNILKDRTWKIKDSNIDRSGEEDNSSDEVQGRNVEENSEVDTDQELEGQTIVERDEPEHNITRSGRVVKKLTYLNDYVAIALNAVEYFDEVPQKFEDIKNRKNQVEWVKAIDEELEALEKNETWEIVDLPRDRKALDCRWVFAVKRDKEGEIERYKARLVAKGCAQKWGLDYNETYAPVASFTTLRVLLAIINHDKLIAHQLDVKNAFLQGELKETIYMKAPEGAKVENGKVCKLKKSLYGLKKAPIVWNNKFDMFVKRLGFIQCESDKCLYILRNDEMLIYLLLYVDDFIIVSNTIVKLERMKGILMEKFQMRDLGELNYFLGI